MNQLDLATEAYGGLETFSRLGFPTLRRVVQRMSAGPALYGPTVILLQTASVASVPDKSSKKERQMSEAGDLQAAVVAFRQDIVFHSPILATVGDEVGGLPTLAKILQTAFTCLGMPQNVEEFQNPDGRCIVTFDGAIDGNLIQIAMLVTEDAQGKAESIRTFTRPWPVVKLFREYMERNLRPDPVPDALWELPASKARQ
jgi:hypothetical protein